MQLHLVVSRPTHTPSMPSGNPHGTRIPMLDLHRTHVDSHLAPMNTLAGQAVTSDESTVTLGATASDPTQSWSPAISIQVSDGVSLGLSHVPLSDRNPISCHLSRSETS